MLPNQGILPMGKKKIAGYLFACKGNFRHCFTTDPNANRLLLDLMFWGWDSKVPYYYY